MMQAQSINGTVITVSAEGPAGGLVIFESNPRIRKARTLLGGVVYIMYGVAIAACDFFDLLMRATIGPLAIVSGAIIISAALPYVVDDRPELVLHRIGMIHWLSHAAKAFGILTRLFGTQPVTISAGQMHPVSLETVVSEIHRLDPALPIRPHREHRRPHST